MPGERTVLPDELGVGSVDVTTPDGGYTYPVLRFELDDGDMVDLVIHRTMIQRVVDHLVRYV